MSRLRSSLHTAKHKRSAKIPTEIANDLNFHIEILDLARKGMSMNLLRYRKADILYRANTCPTGLGGYSARGRARHFMIPINLQLRATQNMLEHLVLIIGPWIDIIEGNMKPFSCLISMTDSTSIQGWLKKSTFKENDKESKEMTPAKLHISRSHAL